LSTPPRPAAAVATPTSAARPLPDVCGSAIAKRSDPAAALSAEVGPRDLVVGRGVAQCLGDGRLHSDRDR
jgi:hypothetical protein